MASPSWTRRTADIGAVTRTVTRVNSSRSLRYWVALSVATAAVVTASLWGVQSRFGWLELWDRGDPPPSAVTAPSSEPDIDGNRPPAPAAFEVVSATLDAAVVASSDGVADPAVTSGTAVGATGPGVCTAAVEDAVVSTAAKVTSADADTVAVAVAAVGPGLGAERVAALRSALRGCPGVRITAVDAGAGGAFRAASTGTLTTVLRRGDVVVTVLSVGAANEHSTYDNTPDGVRHDGIVAATGDALAAALTGVCVDEVGGDDGPARNPHSGAKFTGFLVTRTVTVDDLPEPIEPPQVTASTSTTVPAGGTVAALDDWVVRLRTVTDISELTEPPVSRPRWQRYPSRPEPAPTSRSYQVRVEDPTGPGCGWEFTATAPPAADSDALARAAAEAKELNLVALAAARDEAAAAELTYDEELAAYDSYAQRRRVWELYDETLRLLTPPPPTTTLPPPSSTTPTTPTTSTTVPPVPTTTPTTTPTTAPPATTTTTTPE